MLAAGKVRRWPVAKQLKALRPVRGWRAPGRCSVARAHVLGIAGGGRSGTLLNGD